MRDRTHGQARIDQPEPGEQQRSGARPSRRAASGPRPVRPPVPPGSARPESGPRPVPAGIVGDRASCGPADVGAAEIGAAEIGAAEIGAAGIGAAEIGAADVATADVGGAGRAPVGRGVGSAPVGRTVACGRTVDGMLPARQTAAVRGPRVLVRRPVPPVPRSGEWVRRIAGGLVAALVTAAVVFGLGWVADAAAQARGSASPVVAEVTVTVEQPGTVWDVVDGVAPSVSGPQRAAMVDQVVAVNSLSSVRVWPGEVLRVPLR